MVILEACDIGRVGVCDPERPESYRAVVLRCLRDKDRAAIVVPAIRTGSVRKLLGVAIRTFRYCRRGRLIVCSAFPAACFRMSSFWIWHCGSSGTSCGPPVHPRLCVWAGGRRAVRSSALSSRSWRTAADPTGVRCPAQCRSRDRRSGFFRSGGRGPCNPPDRGS